jgi:DNA recombination protein RmuC
MQKAFRARVMLVSPSLLMLSIQVLQVIVKDARMQEQTEIIRSEVGKLMEDIGRLRDRAFNLQKHFGQASEDIEQVLISADKLTKRGARIEALEFDEDSAARGKRPEIPAPLGLKLGAAE